MSENSANKRNNYFIRKRNNKNKIRNDPDDSSSNYQRLLSNSSKSDSRNYTSQMNPIILKYVNGGKGEPNLLPYARPKIWGDMELYMSKESLDAVKAKPNYEQLKATFNVVAFLKLIKEVHCTEPAVRSSADAVADALQEFHSIKQSSDESLIDYKNRILAAVERIATADPAQKPDASTVARKFTRSLDLNLFEELVRQCRDDETKYAATLSA